MNLLKFSLIFLKIIKFANIDSNNDGFLNGQKARSLYIYIYKANITSFIHENGKYYENSSNENNER